jgi:CheY-like chemotaxis protein
MKSYAPVLLVEDDENDILLMRHAFEEAQLPNPLIVARNGEEAISYLNAERNYTGRKEASWPGVVLLDLKMPLKDGWDVLTWLQKPRHRKGLPVVILSSSDNELDIKRAMALGANAYRVKPFDLKGLVRLTEELRDSWLTPDCATAAKRWTARGRRSVKLRSSFSG